MRPLRSLRSYLLVLVFAVIVPFVGLAAYLIARLIEEQALSARERAAIEARQVAGALRSRLSRLETSLTNLAARPGIRAMKPNSRPTMLDMFLERNPLLVSLYVASPGGQVLHISPESTNQAQVSFANLAWFPEMLNTNRMVISKPMLDPLTGRWILMLACPVREEQVAGSIGGLCACLGIEELASLLARTSAPAGRVVTVIDRDGEIVTQSVDATRWVGKPVAGTDLEHAASAGNLHQPTEPGGALGERLYGSATVPTTGWRVLVEIPFSTVFAAARADVVKSILLTFATTALALGLAVWLGRRVARPIRQVARAAREVAEGRWSGELALDGPAELSVVAREFNAMFAARGRAEATLRTAEEKFRMLAERSLTGVYIIKSDRYVYANPRMAEIFGYPTEAMLGMHPLDLVTPEDRPLVSENIRRRLEGETPGVHYTWRGLRSDGAIIEVEVFGSRIDVEGQPAVVGTLLDVTERRQIEEDLRKAKDFAENVLHTASVMIVRLDVEGRVTEFNAEAEKVTGYTREEILGRNWFELIVPKQRYPGVWSEFDRLRSDGLPRIFENPILTKSGEERAISWSNNRVYERGRVVGTISFGLDLTEHRRAEAALRRSEETYRSLVEQSVDGVFMVSPEGRFLEANPAGCQMSGFTREEMLERTILDMVAPEEQGRAPQVLGEILSGKTVRTEWMCRRKDGASWLAELTAKRLPDGCIQSIIRDVSERRKAEEAVRESEAKYKALIEATNTGYVILDAKGRVLDANAEYARLAGGERAEDIVGRSVAEWTAPHDRQRNEAEVRRCLERGSVRDLEIDYINKAGGFTPVEINATVLRGTGEDSILSVCRNITERKRAEEALRQAELKYRSLVENIPAITYMASPVEPFHILFVSPQIEVMGYPRADWLVEPELRFRLVHPDDRDRVHAVLHWGVPTGQYQVEYRMTTHEGREMWVRDTAVVIRDALGHALYVQGVLVDITGVKLAETAVRVVSSRLLNLQEEERRRIARELHDTTGQNLTALSMNLTALRAAVPQTNSAAVRALEEALRLTSQCLHEIRTFSYLLHPPVLDELGLVRALHDYARGFQQRSGIKLELDLGQDLGALPKETEVTLFRVVQECLGNIHRHSGSRTAAIRLWREGQDVWLEVQDMGKGISEAQIHDIERGESHFGVGIAGMRERMKQLGGRLDIRSSRKGTTVQAVVPLGISAAEA